VLRCSRGAGPFRLLLPAGAAPKGFPMDLLTAVAVSMLGVSRLRAASAFKAVQRLDQPRHVVLDAVLAACGNAPEAWPLLSVQAQEMADQAVRAGRAAGIEPVPLFADRYPALMACIPDPPPVLWCKGDLDVLTRPGVAIVGSRAATPYALQVGGRLGAELADRGLLVVSGLARGVDSAAHRGCLDARGVTVAVLGSGIDRIYPSEHAELAASISKQGVLVSELGPGAAPLPEHFPLRNRIISGISLAVVVVEASEKSGSLITARCALDQGRDVMAVPGSVLSGRNRGSHALLKDGAKVVETADDILEELGWPSAVGSSRSISKSLNSDPLLTKMDHGEVYRLDDLVEMTGMSGARLLSRLMELELSGLVAGAGGGRFARVS
jgi:DNA processing protein